MALRRAGTLRVEYRPGYQPGIRQVEPRGRGGQVEHLIADRHAHVPAAEGMAEYAVRQVRQAEGVFGARSSRLTRGSPFRGVEQAEPGEVGERLGDATGAERPETVP
ncbi:hypothetical protein [Nonomuraea turcica]|uniref:hypothetical protein n=1 Tax=Nonomuraea sp. G32 TaxID=3067274 RepID=UPI00273AF945|nr:hypothetical protein [Nonomuraea sp. G32]MDP4510200.1 hypothetical protein [Nonomuraea sp. G32]